MPLTDAIDDYVGEPREPAERLPATDFDRLMDSVANLPPELIGTALAGFSSVAAPPTRPAEQPATPTLPPSRTVRRANLAQSRRLGLDGRNPAPADHPETDPVGQPDPPEQLDAEAATKLTDAEPDQFTTATTTKLPIDERVEPVGAVGAVGAVDQADNKPAQPIEPHAFPAAEIQTAPGPIEWPGAVAVRFRSLLPDLPPRPTPLTQPAAPTRATVPPAVTTVFEQQFGVGVAAVPVHRGPAVAELARAKAALAFTERGEVYLPDEAGDLATPNARALLAHELVHAVQQRTLGAALPGEQSSDGRELEAAAIGIADWFRNAGQAPRNLLSPANQPTPATTATQAPPTHTQRATEVTASPEQETPATSWQLPAGAAAEILGGVPNEPPSDERPAQNLTELRNTVADLAETVAELKQGRPANQATPDQPAANYLLSVDDLAVRIYPQIQAQLRAELSIDRERAGLHTDLF